MAPRVGFERFASALRRYRLAAGLSQEALAERSGLSARGVSNLERGISRAPCPGTVGRLADALGLDRVRRAELAAAAHGQLASPAPEAVHARTVVSSTDSFLPRELNSFVGRVHELAELERMIAEKPLVTLTGPGGAGKTRLALHFAHGLAEQSAAGDFDDVRLVELAAVTDPEVVVRAVATAAGAAEVVGTSLLDTLRERLTSRRVLLILDNCEHVVHPAAVLAETLLRGCPDLHVLATSREPLDIEGEMVYRIQPLGLPYDDTYMSLLDSAAVQLFVDRAQAIRPDFSLSDDGGIAIGNLCRQLDGLPLAIELAAAWTAVLAPAEIASHVSRAAWTPATRRRTAPRRQQTLDAAIAWSYDLLARDERLVFDRLSVFAGGFALDGAEALAGADLDGSAAVDVLARLVARSMVQAERQDGSVRYRVLEPLRRFGQARLLERGELDFTRRRHAEYVRDLAEDASPRMRGPEMRSWFRRLEAEWDNIRTAHAFAVEASDAELGLRLAWALWWWWSRPDRQAEGRTRLERALGMPDVALHAELHGRVLAGAAFLAVAQSDLAAADTLVTETLDVGHATGDAWVKGLGALVLGTLHLFRGDLSSAEAVLRAGVDQTRQDSLAWVEARNLEALGQVALARSDLPLAEAHLRAALSLARAELDQWSQAMALSGLADVLRSRGDVEAAGAAYHEARQVFAAIDARGLAAAGPLHNLAYVALGGGDVRGAARMFDESAALYADVGTDRRGLAECVAGLASVAVHTHQPELAARLFGAVESALEQLGTMPTPSNRADAERSLASLRAQMDAAELAVAWQNGRTLSLEAALVEARRVLVPTQTG